MFMLETIVRSAFHVAGLPYTFGSTPYFGNLPAIISLASLKECNPDLLATSWLLTKCSGG